MKKAADYILAIVLVISIMCQVNLQPVFAAEDTIVRIGLVSLYGDKSSIKVHNNTLEIGYRDDNFSACGSLISESGFEFLPFNEYCYTSVNIYNTYDLAKAAANKLGNSDVAVGIQGKNVFKLYTHSADAITAAMVATGIENSSGIKFEADTSEDKYRVVVKGTFGQLIIDADSNNKYPQFKAGTANEAGVFVINLGERQYRGEIEIGRYKGSNNLTAVNIIDMESYLYGVVPCEVVSSWPDEALKAQAVCARSYAYALDSRTTDFNASIGYALYDTTQSQVYKGYGYEQASTNEAVNATAGKMIYFRENVIKAFFYSTSGGHTASCENVWDVPLTYFRSVNDNTESYQEKKPWIVSYSYSDIASIMNAASKTVGTVSNISPVIKDDSGRIYQLKVTGDLSTEYLFKEKISSLFRLPSTKAKIIKYGDIPDRVTIESNSKKTTDRISNCYVISGDGTTTKINENMEQYIVISGDNLTNFPKNGPSSENAMMFAGMGYGHGVGLSQSGAKSLADAGYTYEDIIYHYYNRVEIR